MLDYVPQRVLNSSAVKLANIWKRDNQNLECYLKSTTSYLPAFVMMLMRIAKYNNGKMIMKIMIGQ